MAFERIVIPNSTATINVSYNGFIPQAQTAFQRAVDIWQTLIVSPVTVNVTATWQPTLNSDGTVNTTNLGYALPANYETNFTGAPLANVQYPVALANSLAGQDLDTAQVDIDTSFNSSRTDWYLGVDGNVPPNQYDLVSVVLHELGHALGFTNSFSFDDRVSDEGVRLPTYGQGSRADPSQVFDQFIENGANQNLTDATPFPNNSTQLGDELIGNNLFLDSPTTGAVNNGNPVKLYAPNTWKGGSSIVHLDDTTYNNTIDALMTHSQGPQEVIRQPGAITFRLFQDMGWRMNTEGWMYGTSVNNTLIGTNIDQNLFGLEGDDTLFSRGGDDALYGCAGSDSLFGEDGNDIIFGGSGNDELDGGVGNDEMSGEEGNDTYYVDSINDRVIESNSDGTNPGGIDTIYSSVSYTLGKNLENLNLLESGGVINGTGNEQNNVITGNSADNVLDGQANSDTLFGGVGKDVLYGGTGDDTLYGDADDDLLVGGTGSDFIDGGSGVNDTVSYENTLLAFEPPYGVTVNIDETQDYQTPGKYIYSDLFSSTVISFDPTPDDEIAAGTALNQLGNQDILRNLENITGSSLDDVLVGNGTGNRIQGLLGNDIFIGNAGNDTLDGGGGIDTVSYRYDPKGIFINLEQNTATDGFDTVDELYDIENIQGSDFSDRIIGSDQDNWLFGGNGDDTLTGRAGADTLVGEDGIDTASYTDSGIAVIVNLTTGKGAGGDAEGDTLQSIENLQGSQWDDKLIGDNNDNNLFGRDGQDILYGHAGQDSLDGGDGNDTLNGDAGDDVLYGRNGNDTLDGGADNDVLYGGGDNDSLSGSTGDDILYGENGNDILDGGSGNDSMTGGTGNDIYVVESSGDTVTETVNQGRDTVKSSITYTLGANLENLILTGKESINGMGNNLENIILGNDANNLLFGDAGKDTLLGGDGDDTLDGGVNSDAMAGGLGNDTYIVDNSTDQIIENENEGIDTVNTSASYILSNNLENLNLTGSKAINGTGNSLDNIISGNDAVNYIYAGDGADLVSGAAGDDYIYGEAGNDSISGGKGDDNLNGGQGDDIISGNKGQDWLVGDLGDDQLLGGAGKDHITGGMGNDVIVGGADKDWLTGGAGADQFAFHSWAQGIDIITDFRSTDGDRIVISAKGFGKGLKIGTLSENQFCLGSIAKDKSDRLIYDSATGNLFFDADGTGSAKQIQFATLPQGLSLTQDSILVTA
jgi:Ca2+-binding RTX toxin-like protein